MILLDQLLQQESQNYDGSRKYNSLLHDKENKENNCLFSYTAKHGLR